MILRHPSSKVLFSKAKCYQHSKIENKAGVLKVAGCNESSSILQWFHGIFSTLCVLSISISFFYLRPSVLARILSQQVKSACPAFMVVTSRKEHVQLSYFTQVVKSSFVLMMDIPFCEERNVTIWVNPSRIFFYLPC